MTSALFDVGVNNIPFAPRLVMALFYTNIFLVLVDYILVMSHAVSALLGEGTICIPTAGLLASTLMVGVAQIRTMAKLGRAASWISLAALAIVVVQCLYHAHRGDEPFSTVQEQEATDTTLSVIPGASLATNTTITFWKKLAALGSIGFAVGSQKLFLNIRHEFRHRHKAPKALGMSLLVFGSVYILICLLSGSSKLKVCMMDVVFIVYCCIASVLQMCCSMVGSCWG